jgi:hypothetical protein
MGLLSSIGKIATRALDINQAFFSSPVTTLTKGINAGIKKTKEKSISQNVASIVGTTATLAGALLAPTTAVGRSTVSRVASSLVPKTITGKLALGTAGLVAGQAVVKSPKKAAETIIKAPGSFLQTTSDIADVVIEPTPAKVKDFVVNNPITTAVGGTALLGAGALKVAPAVSSLLQNQKIDALTDAIETQNQKPITTEPQTKANVPITPATQTVAKNEPLIATAGKPNNASQKRRKRRTAPKKQNINQRVNIVLQNANYLKSRCY